MAGIENRLNQLDEYVMNRVGFMEARGFLPPIDSANPPTMESIRQTLKSQDGLTDSSCQQNEVMVPNGWVDPEHVSGTIFQKGKLKDGIVISVDIGGAKFIDGSQIGRRAAQSARDEIQRRGLDRATVSHEALNRRTNL